MGTIATSQRHGRAWLWYDAVCTGFPKVWEWEWEKATKSTSTSRRPKPTLIKEQDTCWGSIVACECHCSAVFIFCSWVMWDKDVQTQGSVPISPRLTSSRPLVCPPWLGLITLLFIVNHHLVVSFSLTCRIDDTRHESCFDLSSYFATIFHVC